MQAHAQAAAAVQMVQARFIMAMQNPRNEDVFRTEILHECKRPNFAQSALYSLPRGNKKVTGLTARFAETAARLWGNLYDEATVVVEDDEGVTIRVAVMDLERNITHSNDVQVSKTTERQDAGDREILGSRTNSEGKPVYIVRATDEEFLQRKNSAISKAKRNEWIRMLPADVIDECKAQINETRVAEVKRDPDEARKNIIDNFGTLNVGPAELVEYLGCDLSQASPVQLGELRALYVAIRDGETSWLKVQKARAEEDETGDESAALKMFRDKAKAAARKKEESQSKAGTPPQQQPQPKAEDGKSAGGEQPKPEAAKEPPKQEAQPKQQEAAPAKPQAQAQAKPAEAAEDKAQKDEKPTLTEAKDKIATIMRDLITLVGNEKAALATKGLSFTGKKSGADRQGVVDAFQKIIDDAREAAEADKNLGGSAPGGAPASGGGAQASGPSTPAPGTPPKDPELFK